MESENSSLPPHVEETVRSVAELHAEHSRQASLYERVVERVITGLARPAAVGTIGLLMAAWIVLNLALMRFGRPALDPAPFAYLQGAVTASALLTTVLILATQRRENVLSERRAQLTLQMAIINEQKVAKLIALVEQQRRDNPLIADRVDEEAQAMAQPSDTTVILDAIRDTHAELLADDVPSPDQNVRNGQR